MAGVLNNWMPFISKQLALPSYRALGALSVRASPQCSFLFSVRSFSSSSRSSPPPPQRQEGASPPKDASLATIFDRIINKEIKANIVFEDEQALAFKDVDPQAPVRILNMLLCIIGQHLPVLFLMFLSVATL